MKIGIITQSLQGNYGGILQNYALQTVLKRMGHNPVTIDQLGIWIPNFWNDLAINIKVFLYNLIFGKRKLFVKQYLEIKDRAISDVQNFVHRNINATPKCWGLRQFAKIAQKQKFDAYIVGSDQVWRPCYAPNIGVSYLEFTKDIDAIRIAYAASFGVDNWEYTPAQTKKCRVLARRFDGISVREESGVDLCRKHLNIDAIQVLDPTMLLEKEDYCRLLKDVDDSGIQKIFTYILDSDQGKKDCIKSISNRIGLECFSINQEEPFSFSIPEDETKRYYPPIEDWLKAFRDSSYVVCDSFHGTVFSIIFNKPFVVLKNDARGNARFTSLLKMFGLESRLANSDEAVDILLKPIDWEEVNAKRQLLITKSIDFLNKYLNE